jgi:hypothetical protein
MGLGAGNYEPRIRGEVGNDGGDIGRGSEGLPAGVAGM